jgi:Cu2+-exporting ATPase
MSNSQAQDPSIPVTSADKHTCYQCGLPVPENLDLHFQILGKERYFCCHGCHAVAQTIVETGNEEYYKFREVPDGSDGPAVVPDFLQNLEVYDKPEVQKSFVRSGKAGTQEAFLILEDIRCAACVWLNEQQLRKLHGVIEVDMDYTSHQARVVWDPEEIQLSEILFTIAAIGYHAHPFDPVQREKLIAEQKRKSINKLLFSGILGMEVMAHAIATYWMGGVQENGELALWEIIGRWTDLVVVTAMLFYSGADFFVSAWRDLKNKQLGMDVPVVIGLTTAYVGSVFATIAQQHEVYFDSIAMFIFLMLAARYYELQGRMQAASSLDRLLKIIPKTANRLKGGVDGKVPEGAEQEEVLVAELEEGDFVRIQPGETVPVDGVLISEQSSFDESLLTGEMMPVIHKAGDPLVSGSCNVDQAVVMRVLRPATQSTLNDIRTLLDKGVKSRPSYAMMAERAAKWFVLAILLIATATALSWWFINPELILPVTISVLIVTCPCALALATPVALSLSSGLFAKMGVLPLKMSAIEGLSQSDTVIFDKTGTLTQGQPELIQTEVIDRQFAYSESDFLKIATALEWYSEHPIAKAFKQLFEEGEGLPEVAQRVNHPGVGIEGVVEGGRWKIGKLSFCCDVDKLPHEWQKFVRQQRQAGNIVIALAQGASLKALFVLQDRLRSEVAEVISQLKSQGIRQVVILSGDHPQSVARVAELVGADEYLGDQSPEDKLKFIQSQQERGHHVIMVGDGINDAPTLAAANVSVSFAEATDLAQLNSDFVLMGQQLTVLPKMRELSQKTRRIIIQNLTWALGYNFTAVPFAAFGFIPPWGAALGMSLSSFIVISNSLRLKSFYKGDKGDSYGKR